MKKYQEANKSIIFAGKINFLRHGIILGRPHTGNQS